MAGRSAQASALPPQSPIQKKSVASPAIPRQASERLAVNSPPISVPELEHVQRSKTHVPVLPNRARKGSGSCGQLATRDHHNAQRPITSRTYLTKLNCLPMHSTAVGNPALFLQNRLLTLVRAPVHGAFIVDCSSAAFVAIHGYLVKSHELLDCRCSSQVL